MLTLSCALPVVVSPEVVWPYYEKFDLRKQWETDLEKYVLDGPFATGTTGSMVLTGMPPITFTLTSVMENREFWDEVVLPGMGTLRFGHEFLTVQGRNMLRHSIEFAPASGEVDAKSLSFFKQVSHDLPDVLWRLVNAAR